MKLLAECLDHKQHPITHLVISHDWSEDELDAADNMFEKYGTNREECSSIDGFERELRDRFGITYQTVKHVVLAMWREDRWKTVCKAYADANDVLEFCDIRKSELD